MNNSSILVKLAFCMSVLSGCSLSTDIDVNPGLNNQEDVQNSTNTTSLPNGYTLDKYSVEKVTDSACNQNTDCETPMEYLVQSRCPFTSLCLENKCTVVCPDFRFQGEHPCNLDPDAGTCEAAKPRYYYDKQTERCQQFLWGGCDGVVPFDTIDVCQKTCEQDMSNENN